MARAICILFFVLCGCTQDRASAGRALCKGAFDGNLRRVSGNLGYGPDLACAGGLTPLMLASARGHTEVVKTLLNAGANVNAGTTQDGLTPLMMAAHGGHLPVIELLASRGAAVNAKDKGDRGAIDWASLNQQTEKEAAIAVVKLLASRGAALRRRDALELYITIGGAPDIPMLVAKAGAGQ